MQPKTRYARSGDAHIAYQVVGEGPVDLIFVPGLLSHLDLQWESPFIAAFWQRLASFSRLILYDKRGTGLSGRLPGVVTLEERVEDIRAVMEATGSKRAALFGLSEGGPTSLLYAAHHPDRVSHLMLFGTYASVSAAPDSPEAARFAYFLESIAYLIENHWGEGRSIEFFLPSAAAIDVARELFGRVESAVGDPKTIRASFDFAREADIRLVVPTIRAPALVMHRTGDRAIPVEMGRWLGRNLPGARFVELPGDDHVPFAPDVADLVEEFLTGVSPAPECDRVLSTVLFTDIVGSTEHAARLGDRSWRDLLEQHHTLIRRELTRFRGREVDTAGDGFFATFDGPARAVRCACTIRTAVRQLGIEIRAGLHTGEVELSGDKVGGIAVHIGARVLATARAGEVLVSSTVKDLVAGSGIGFTNRGGHVLKGIPGEWQVFAAT